MLSLGDIAGEVIEGGGVAGWAVFAIAEADEEMTTVADMNGIKMLWILCETFYCKYASTKMKWASEASHFSSLANEFVGCVRKMHGNRDVGLQQACACLFLSEN